MKKYTIITIVISLMMVACKSTPEQSPDNNSELIQISKEQFNSEKMEFGTALILPFADVIYFTGNIIPTTDGQAQISLPLPGIINKIYIKPGQFISKGSEMFEVSGNEFIDIQKDFAESAAITSRLKSDYLRAKELFNQNILATKDFTYAESNYYAENAKYTALKIKLEKMGLDVSRIEKGEFYSSFSIKAPISGFVSNIQATIGQYIEPHQNIAIVIDNNSFQIKLSVFEKNINKIKTGQTVEFYLNGNKSTKYKAIINTVGKSINYESKSVECYATIDNVKNINIVNNQFVEGEIYADCDSALAVPETAILNFENDKYLLLFEKEENSTYYFKKIKVKTGRKANNYVELKENLPSEKLLIKGVYNIHL
jgi:cobalt-zinc-cadmium efflux system membrane fusion protein